MLAVGETLQGRYRIVREIGAGGMGTVYEGENLLIRRRVAIKVMRADAGQSPELCARFEREAQIASQIPSDHITEVLDLGELDSGVRFIVMEYLVGETLSARLARMPRIAPRELLGLIRQVLAALDAAHRAGVIHRDVKPDNVFILGEKAGRSDFVKLLDFGISKIRANASDVPLTQNGMFVGTPAYMAPEQVGGGEASPLWDLYSVGVLLYRGLTGETPFQGVQLDQLVYRVALGKFDPPSARVPGLDPALDALVCRAMARLPQDRFQSAEQFSTALNAWLGEHPTELPPSSHPPLRTAYTQAGSGGHTARLDLSPAWRVPSTRDAVPAAAAAAASAPFPTTRVTTELGVASRRRTPAWLTWTGLGVLLAAVAAAFALSRNRPGSSPPLVDENVLAAQPGTTPEAAAPASSPPSVAPAAAPLTPPAATPTPAAPHAEAAAGTSPALKARTRKPSAGSAAADRSRSPSARQTAAEEAATEKAATDSAPAMPAGKPRPDWGY
ncbi:MAG: serine/threonine-protein kinase [Deltaproteobacteria bacterium]